MSVIKQSPPLSRGGLRRGFEAKEDEDFLTRYLRGGLRRGFEAKEDEDFLTRYLRGGLRRGFLF